MLSRILDEYRKSGGFISLDQLCRELEIERSTLEGMLETLVRQGKLREIPATSAACGGCHGGSCGGCGSHKPSANMGKSYESVG
jgi:hypothetical protein